MHSRLITGPETPKWYEHISSTRKLPKRVNSLTNMGQLMTLLRGRRHRQLATLLVAGRSKSRLSLILSGNLQLKGRQFMTGDAEVRKHRKYSHLFAAFYLTFGLFRWTNDPSLQSYRFCNTFRVTDATCQYLIQYCIRAGSQDPTELIFRVLLFDTFTRVDTWEYIVQHIGAPTWENYNRRTYAKVLRQATNQGLPLYTGSFQKPSPLVYGHKEAFMNHLQGLEELMNAGLPSRFVSATSMSEVFDWLRSFKGFGDFNAYQLLLNLSYTGLGNFTDFETFVVVGCGAREGLKRCFVSGLSRSMEIKVIQWMQRTQRDHFNRLGLSCTLGPPGSLNHELLICDIEHTLCEIDKVRHHSSARTTMLIHSRQYVRKGRMRVFKPTETLLPEPVFPITPLDNREERWVITRIIGWRKLDKVLQYQIVWEGYKEPTWEPAEMILQDAPLLVEKYLRSLA